MPVGWVCLWDQLEREGKETTFTPRHQCLSAGCVFGTRRRLPPPGQLLRVTNACRLGVSLGPQGRRLPPPGQLLRVTNACRLGVSLGPQGRRLPPPGQLLRVTNACRLGVSLGPPRSGATSIASARSHQCLSAGCVFGTSWVGPSRKATPSPMPVGWVCLWDLRGNCSGLSGDVTGSPMPVGWVCLWDAAEMAAIAETLESRHQCLSAGCVFGTCRRVIRASQIAIFGHQCLSAGCVFGTSSLRRHNVGWSMTTSPMPVGWVCLWDVDSLTDLRTARLVVTNACRLGVSLGLRTRKSL